MTQFVGEASGVTRLKCAVFVFVLATTGGAANTEIHRCLLGDGTTAFQETPCPEPAAPADESSEPDESGVEDNSRVPRDDVFDFVNPHDEPADPPTDSEPATPEAVSQDRAECEKSTRDAIDAIDLEMRGNTYTKEQGEAYLAELLALTKQLRECKQL